MLVTSRSVVSKLSLIKTICSHYTLQYKGMLDSSIIQSIQEMCQAWTHNPFCHFFVEEILCYYLCCIIINKRFICINGKPLCTFHPGFPGLAPGISWRGGVLYHVEFISLNKRKVVRVVLIEILQLSNFYIRYLLSFFLLFLFWCFIWFVIRWHDHVYYLKTLNDNSLHLWYKLKKQKP